MKKFFDNNNGGNTAFLRSILEDYEKIRLKSVIDLDTTGFLFFLGRSLYKKRTGVERVNGRIDRDYRFERHTIRGLQKMNMFMTVSFLIYMTLAKAKIENGQTEHICKMYA